MISFLTSARGLFGTYLMQDDISVSLVLTPLYDYLLPPPMWRLFVALFVVGLHGDMHLRTSAPARCKRFVPRRRIQTTLCTYRLLFLIGLYVSATMCCGIKRNALNLLYICQILMNSSFRLSVSPSTRYAVLTRRIMILDKEAAPMMPVNTCLLHTIDFLLSAPNPIQARLHVFHYLGPYLLQTDGVPFKHCG
ncbi:unnamed protein product [Somion occarium]|uniref:Uncharacterized protein n=1 Tax=Somion occarium TaxID=3059160 RepID=A0ABP1E6M2_9APHY